MRRRLAAAWAACLCLFLATAAVVTEAAAAGPDLDARAWSLVDARTGDVLAGRMSSRRLPIASATKLMTAHLSLDRLSLDRRIAASTYRALPAESKINLRPGERLSVRDLLRALLLESANDAAVTLARGVAGGTSAFVAEMNGEARRLGLRDTHYANPIGLDARGNYSSARDLAALTRRLLRNRLFRRIVDSPSAVLRTGARVRRVVNRNKLIFRFPWITGVKTGHTLGAGYVLIGAGRRAGVTLVSVVLGARSEAGREAATLRLFDYGFSRYRRLTPIRAGRTLARPRLRFSGGHVGLAASHTVDLAVRRGERVKTTVRAPEQVEGPIASGQTLGEAVVSVAGRRAASVPLAATRAIAAPGFADRARERVKSPLVLLLLGSGLVLAGMTLARRRARRRSVLA